MNNLDSITPSIKTGNEQLYSSNTNLSYSVLDFWKWSNSDILSNATRGKFAEFIIATALDIDLNTPSEEWGAYDLLTGEGVKIEVKTSAYIQTWKQVAYSKPIFSIKPSIYGDKENTSYQGTIRRQSDIYIFCLLNEKDQKIIDPLNLDQWEFYIIPTSILNKEKPTQSTISLKPLQKLTGSVSYHLLSTEIQKITKGS